MGPPEGDPPDGQGAAGELKSGTFALGMPVICVQLPVSRPCSAHSREGKRLRGSPFVMAPWLAKIHSEGSYYQRRHPSTLWHVLFQELYVREGDC